MLRATPIDLGAYMMYHRRALSTMKYSRWAGRHGGISHFYNRTAMIEEVQGNVPVTMIDRQMMHYVHRTRERHHQLFRSYQQKTTSTECKLREGEMLRRRWHRKLQKSFIVYMQYATMKVLEDQSRLVTQYGQASVNAALGDPYDLPVPSSVSARASSAAGGKPPVLDQAATEVRERKFAALHRRIRTLPTINVVPKHVATMKQIHNDRFNMRWRVN